MKTNKVSKTIRYAYGYGMPMKALTRKYGCRRVKVAIKDMHKDAMLFKALTRKMVASKKPKVALIGTMASMSMGSALAISVYGEGYGVIH